jgi:hypothetical protein
MKLHLVLHLGHFPSAQSETHAPVVANHGMHALTTFLITQVTAMMLAVVKLDPKCLLAPFFLTFTSIHDRINHDPRRRCMPPSKHDHLSATAIDNATPPLLEVNE